MRFLPSNYLSTVFESIKAHAAPKYSSVAQMQDFLAYVDKTWVTSTVFPISSWCQYDLPVRTNNHTEGYHRSFNDLVGSRPPLHRFIEALHSCAIANRNRLAKEDFDTHRSIKITQRRPKSKLPLSNG